MHEYLIYSLRSHRLPRSFLEWVSKMMRATAPVLLRLRRGLLSAFLASLGKDRLGLSSDYRDYLVKGPPS